MRYATSNVHWIPESNFPHIIGIYEKFRFLKGNILDVGCTNGEFVRICLKKNLNAFGVDIDEDVKYGDRIIKCDLNKDKLPFKSNYFDLINMHAVVEHLKDIHHFMQEAQRVVKVGGKLSVMTYIMNFHGKKYFWDDATHTRPYPPVAMDQLFRMYGFKTILCEPKCAGRTYLWKLPGFIKWNLGNNYIIIGKKLR